MNRKLDGNDAAALAGVLASPLRIAIIERLLLDPCLVGTMAKELDIEQAIVSKQIGILRTAGLLVCRPEGRCRTYTIADPESVAALLTALRETARKAAEHATHCKETRNKEPETATTV